MADQFIAPNCIDRVKTFQRVFVRHFPWLEEIQAAANEWSWLHSHWVCNPIETVRRKQAEDELERVVRALRLLATWDLGVPWWWSMKLEEAAKGDSADQVTKDGALIVEAIRDLGSMHEDGSLEAVLTRFQESAKESLSHVPETGNTKWDAVFAVDALRVVWWRNTDREAPAKALNPASDFAAFLQDGFNYLGVTANPVAAFRRWVAWKAWENSTINRT